MAALMGCIQMIERDNYSLVEAATRVSGDPRNRDENERIVGDFIHLAANGKHSLIVKVAGNLLDSSIVKNCMEVIKKDVPIGQNYLFVMKQTMSNYEAYLANNSEFNRPPFYCRDFDLYENHQVLLLSKAQIEINPDTLHISNKDLKAYQNERTKPQTELPTYLDTKQPRECELGTKASKTERDKMLMLILGMAMDAYGYDPEQSKNKATGSNKDSITSKLALKGINVCDDTIRNYLTEAKKLYNPESQ
jgi:hypothetical protein